MLSIAALAQGSRCAVAVVCATLALSSFASAQPIAGKPIEDPSVVPAVVPPLAPPGVPVEPVAVPPTPAKPDPLPPGAVPALPTDPPVVHHHPHLYDSMHQDESYGLKTLFDSLHPKPDGKGKHWYEKLSIRGYTQFRFGRGVSQDPDGADPMLFGDRSINGNSETFSIRRMRLILSGDVSEHLGVYIQPDFASNPIGSTTSTLFAQLRDAYADVYFDKTKIHRLRVGLSKVPYGFEDLQSSQNRIPLDRTNPINSAVSANERDLGVFYYWTPEEKQKLFKDLVDGGLKGSGNYGVFGFGVYDGQGGSQFDQNLNLHMVTRLTYPWMLPSGQVVEASLQGMMGEVVVGGSAIRPLGRGSAITPAGTGGTQGIREQRVAGTFVWYPQPFGFQAEWNWGFGPGLNDQQTAVEERRLSGGYAMFMYKHDTANYGIWTPYLRYQYFQGGYRAFSNAPYGIQNEFNLGVEWQIRKEMELTLEYSYVDAPNLTTFNRAGFTSYRNFDGSILRCQFQINY